MTDEEIIEALDLCTQQNGSIPCYDCPCWNHDEQECEGIDYTVTRNLINRQKAEYENLDTKLKAMRGAANSYKAENERLNEIIKNCHKEILQKCDSCNNRIKTEAYKEFAERLIKNSRLIAYANGFDVKAVVDVEEIVKIRNEMVGEE